MLALGLDVARIAAISEQEQHCVNVCDLGADRFGLGFTRCESCTRQFSTICYQCGYDVRLTHTAPYVRHSLTRFFLGVS